MFCVACPVDSRFSSGSAAYCNGETCCIKSLGSSDGTSATLTPTSLRLFILASAVPSVPVMIAPACPILLPGGAARPATYAATRFGYLVSRMYWAASSSAEPPISPIKTTVSVPGSSRKSLRTSTKLSPVNGSPPIPRHVDWPIPSCVSEAAIS